MQTFKEILSPEELEKLAALLKTDAHKLEAIGLEKAKKDLLNQKQLAKPGDDLANIDSLITKLDTLEEQDWKDSFRTEQNPNHIYPIIADSDNNCPMLLELNGDKAQQQDTLSTLEKAYQQITGKKDPAKKAYKNAEELPEQLKPLLSNKPFPLTVITLRFDNLRQLSEFKKKMEPLVNEGKIKVSEITPQNASEAQEENANRSAFRR